MTIDKQTLINDIGVTFGALYQSLNRFDQENLNRVPFSGSWTAGQVTEHIIKCGSGIPDRQTRPVQRSPEEKVALIREVFLDFTQKYKASPALDPEQDYHQKEELLQALREIEARHVSSASNAGLDALCTDMELPGFGYLTRYEWLNFILFHTQRHTKQLEDIHKAVTAKTA